MAFNKATRYGESENILDSEVGLVVRTHTATKAMAKDKKNLKAGTLFTETVYAVKEPTSNPKTEDLYEVVDGRYVKTEDTTKTEGKTYYEVKTAASPVGVVLLDYDMEDYDEFPVSVVVQGRLKADKVSAEAKAKAEDFAKRGLYIV